VVCRLLFSPFLDLLQCVVIALYLADIAFASGHLAAFEQGSLSLGQGQPVALDVGGKAGGAQSCLPNSTCTCSRGYTA
jgi:hypothetical protein